MKRSLFIIALTILLSATVWSQTPVNDRGGFAFNYVANIPHQFIGFSIMTLYTQKIGVYADLKASPFVPDDELYGSVSRNKAENVFGDDQIGSKKNFISFDIGITKGITKTIYAYAAAGLTLKSLYRRYYDPLEILGSNGKYYIDDESDQKTLPIGSVGIVVIPGNRLALQFGAQSYPIGVNAGIGFGF